MKMEDTASKSAFDTLLTKFNVPHILEKIFFSLDYDSFRECRKVRKDWKELLSSDKYDNKSEEMRKEKIKNEIKLCTASKLGNIQEVRELLGSGVNKNCERDSRGRTPLHFATLGGRTNVVKLLLEVGANVYKADDKGNTPLHVAAGLSRKFVTIAKMLIDGGADPDQADMYGWTPLHVAARTNNSMCEILLAAGADPNRADNKGWTPLHTNYLTSCRAQLLIAAGADTNKSDKDGSTPLHQAVEWGYKDVVQILLDAGAEPNKADKKGDTPLHWAARIKTNDMETGYGDGIGRDEKAILEKVQILVNRGAKPNIANKLELTPLDVAKARQNPNQDVINVLESHKRKNASGQNDMATKRRKRKGIGSSQS